MRIIAILIVVLIGAVVLLQTATLLRASDNSSVAYGTTQSITAFGVCKKVSNNSSTGKSVYVPTQTSEEWASFYGNPPGGVSIGSCAPAIWTTSYDSPEVQIRSLGLDSSHGVMYAGSSNDGIIYRCDTATNCDAGGDWTTSYNTTGTRVDSIAFDPARHVLYATVTYTGTSPYSIIYRCDTTTNCDAAGDWTASWNTSPLNALFFDPAHQALYAGGATGSSVGVIYRCNTVTGCDAGGDWVTSYSGSSERIDTFMFDSIHGVLYAGGTYGQATRLRRCDTATNCDATSDWTVSFQGDRRSMYGGAFDSIHGVLYVGSGSSVSGYRGIIHRCDTATDCDAAGDWMISSSAVSSDFAYSLVFNPVSGMLYASTGDNDAGSNGYVHRCDTASGCDATSDWSTDYDSPEKYIYSLTRDTIHNVLYAGSGGNGIIYRKDISGGP